MVILGLFIIVSFTSLGVSGQHGHGTKFCYSCHDQVNLAACTQVEKCHGEGHCGAEIYHHHGINMFRLGCFEHRDCEHTHPLVGKRAGHDQIVCRECCAGELCNNKLCGMGATTAATTSSALNSGTTVTSGGCVDHEEDGFSCSLLDKSHFCNDPSTLSYMIAHQKCPKYCGFCDKDGNNIAPAPQATTSAPSTDAPTTADPDFVGGVSISVGGATDAPAPATQCVDIEENGFLCANFDLFNFCTDPNSFAYPLAVEKCKAHCGFCSKTGD